MQKTKEGVEENLDRNGKLLNPSPTRNRIEKRVTNDVCLVPSYVVLTYAVVRNLLLNDVIVNGSYLYMC